MILAVILEYKAKIYRKNKTAIPGNKFGRKNSEAMRVAHSSWIRFRMALGMEGLRFVEGITSLRLGEQLNFQVKFHRCSNKIWTQFQGPVHFECTKGDISIFLDGQILV